MTIDMDGNQYLYYFAGINCPKLAFKLGGRDCNKAVFSPDLFVMLKILSSEYHLYVCGKIFRMVRFERKSEL